VARVGGDAPEKVRGPRVKDASREARPSDGVITAGHRKTIASMSTPAFRELVSAHQTALGDRLTIYFRPTSKGLVRIALHPSAPGYVGFHARAEDHAHLHACNASMPSIEQLQEHLRLFEAWLPSVRRSSDEERGVIPWLRNALVNQLWLSELGEGWAFLHQEWRFVDGIRPARKSDVLAVHIATGQLGIVEFKSSESMLAEARTQVIEYSKLWDRSGDELAPLFTDLVQALGLAYGNELAATAVVKAGPAALFVGVASSATPVRISRHTSNT
jgi:hypothetical protein